MFTIKMVAIITMRRMFINNNLFFFILCLSKNPLIFDEFLPELPPFANPIFLPQVAQFGSLEVTEVVFNLKLQKIILFLVCKVLVGDFKLHFIELFKPFGLESLIYDFLCSFEQFGLNFISLFVLRNFKGVIQGSLVSQMHLEFIVHVFVNPEV